MAILEPCTGQTRGHDQVIEPTLLGHVWLQNLIGEECSSQEIQIVQTSKRLEHKEVASFGRFHHLVDSYKSCYLGSKARSKFILE